MTYEVTKVETLVKYIVCHDVDAELTFRVYVEPIGAFVRLSVIREEYMGDVTARLFGEM